MNSFDSLAIASVNKPLVMELARCDYIQYRENVITLCNNGIGKSHHRLGLGPGSMPEGHVSGFTTAAASQARRNAGT